jgi:serine protease Do
MKSYFLRLPILAALGLLLHITVSAQQPEPPQPATPAAPSAPLPPPAAPAEEDMDTSGGPHNIDEIIIKRKTDKNDKFIIEIHNGEVLINGKPVAEFEDSAVAISRKQIFFNGDGNFSFSGPDELNLVGPRAKLRQLTPFRGGVQSFSGGNSWSVVTNRAFLGVTSEPTEKDAGGARVTGISANSAAAKAGLKSGDVITRIDDITITNPSSLSEAVRQYKPQDKIALTYIRDGKEVKTSVVLGKGKDMVGSYGYSVPRIEEFKNLYPNEAYSYAYGENRPRLGIKAQDTEDGKGVKVLEVGDESSAQKAGVKEGDIITRFDGKEINSATTLAECARAAREKVSVKINLIRDGKPMEVEVKVPRKLKTADL